jgi:hypothetical protein
MVTVKDWSTWSLQTSYPGIKQTTAVSWLRHHMLQARRLQVRFPMRSLDIWIDLFLLAALWPWGWLSFYQKWVPPHHHMWTNNTNFNGNCMFKSISVCKWIRGKANRQVISLQIWFWKRNTVPSEATKHILTYIYINLFKGIVPCIPNLDTRWRWVIIRTNLDIKFSLLWIISGDQ